MPDPRNYNDPTEWLDDQIEEEERFRGIELDEHKVERLAKLYDLCKQIVRLDPQIKCHNWEHDEEDRNGTVQLLLPIVLMIPSRNVNRLLSQLFAEADDVFLSAVGGKEIRLSFCIRQMWKTWMLMPDGGEK